MTILECEPAADELLCVVGPTASGKTALALQLCEQLGGEVVSADSVQVYKHFDLGSGKPTAQERARAVHHLVDCQDPHDPLDAARYAEQASQAIERVRAQSRRPIVCGGTFLWIKALVYGLAQAPGANAEIRSALRAEAARSGVEALHTKLATVDPETAARLSPRDLVRIERALEVFELTGRPLSALHREHRAQPPRYQPRFVSIRWTREQLDARIGQRASQWLEGGWIEEVLGLVDLGYRETRPMRSVGYRQVLDHIEGRLPAAGLQEEIVRATRVFARRQRTWLRDVPIAWIDPTGLR